MPLSTSRRGGPAGGSSWVLVVLALLGAGLLGVAPALLSPAETIVVFAVCGGALALLLIRGALGASGRPAELGATAGALWEQARGPADRDLRVQRWLFCLGALTVTESTWRPALGLTIAEIFFIASFAGCAFAVLRGHQVARVPAALVAGVAIFAFGGAISSFGAQLPADSGTEVLHGVYVMLLWTWTGAMVLRTRRQLLLAVTLWTVSAAVSGLASITQVVGIEAIAGALEGNRATGFSDHPNDLGGAASVALVPALMLATRWAPGTNSAGRALRWLVVALIATGVALSASVAGMAGALLAIVVWISSPAVRASARVAIVAALAITLVVAVAVTGGAVTSPTERIEQVTSTSGTDPAAGSGEERIEIVRTVWPRIAEDPLIGAGLDTPDTVVTVLSGGRTTPYQVHGAPLAAWYGAGIFGVLGILIVFVAVLAAGWRALVAAPGADDRLIGWALLAAFGSFVVYAMTAPLFFQQYGWFAAVVLVAWSAGSEAVARDRSPAWSRRPAGLPVAPASAR